MKRILRPFLLAVLLLIGLNTPAQIGITSYNFSTLAINTSQNRMISGELKTFLNYYSQGIKVEVDLFYNFKAREYHRFSVGVGINGYPFEEGDIIHALTVPLQLEVYPIQDFKRISILYEFTPQIEFEDDFSILHLFGIRYSFGEGLSNEENN